MSLPWSTAAHAFCGSDCSPFKRDGRRTLTVGPARWLLWRHTNGADARGLDGVGAAVGCRINGRVDMKRIRTAAIGALSALVYTALAAADPAAAPSLNDVYATLSTKRFVDLTHAFGPSTPHWKGFGEMKIRTLYTIEKAGFHVDEFCHVGQWGTHVDPPAHFHEGLKTVDQIDPKDMLMPLVVLDVHRQVARNPDYVVSLDDVKAWESRHGLIPAHAFVALRTDWSHRWPNDAAMQNKDAAGVAHYPGWSM